MSDRTVDMPRAWVTGAGKGIGRALALALAEKGWTVAVSARTESDLATLVSAAGPGRLAAYPLDITDEAAVQDAASRIEADLGALDVVVLCAGTHKPVTAKNFDTQAFRTLVETNLMGTVHCLGAIMPRFIARGRGRIAVVASMVGYCGLPTAAAYGATKAGLINMCEALKPELERQGVTLQLVAPGFVDTPLTRLNDFPMPFMVSAETAARAIAKGLESRRFEIAFPRRMEVAMKILRMLPYRAFFAVTRRMVS